MNPRAIDKPVIFAVGLEKCGTTSLHSLLEGADNVASPNKVFKEPEYFRENYSKGLQWYLNQYDTSRDILIDMTPTYHWSTSALDRIERDVSRKIVILIFRNPIARSVSAYIHQRYWFFEDAYLNKRNYLEGLMRSYVEVAKKGDEYVFTSYRRAYERVAERIAREAILVLSFDGLITNTSAAVTRIERGIGRKLGLPGSLQLPRTNSLVMPQFYMGHELEQHIPTSVLQNFDPNWVYFVTDQTPRKIAPPEEFAALKAVQEKWNEPIPSAVISPVWDKYYAGEIDMIRGLTGDPLPTWPGTAVPQAKPAMPTVGARPVLND